MNFIGIDISLNSTAIYIENSRNENFIISFTNKKSNNKYIKELSEYNVEFNFLERKKTKEYTKSEILKLKQFDEISNKIFKTIISKLDITKKTYCNIEGYAYTKNTSSLLDIVTFSTLIRLKLLKNIPNINIDIIPPSSLKLDTCKYVYKPKDIGKRKPKLIWENYDGISGGSFKKHQMFQAILDGNVDSPILKFLKDNKDLLDLKSIPNPIEDIIDSIFALKVKKKEVLNK